MSFPSSYPFIPRLYKADRPVRSLYIHVPFCQRRCSYCDFCVIPTGRWKTESEVFDRYLEALEIELIALAVLLKATGSWAPLATCYIGGGTPSLLGTQRLLRLMHCLSLNFGFEADAECTLELNPETQAFLDFESLSRAGINRLSFGVQAKQEVLLRPLGRLHREGDVIDCVRRAKAAGIHDLSADLMLAIPGQRFEDIKETGLWLSNLGVDHISAYSLILEEGTALWRQVKAKKVSLPNEDEERELMHQTVQLLAQEGYRHYEVSNFGRKERISRHNCVYWLGEVYAAAGLGASGFCLGKRFQVSSDQAKYERVMRDLSKCACLRMKCSEREKNLALQSWAEEDAAGLLATLSQAWDKIDEEDEKEQIRDYLCFAPRCIFPFGGLDFERRFGRALTVHERQILERFCEQNWLLALDLDQMTELRTELRNGALNASLNEPQDGLDRSKDLRDRRYQITEAGFDFVDAIARALY